MHGLDASTEDLHPVFKNDPAELQRSLYRSVELTSEDGSAHTGRVVAVDPVSESRILMSEDPLSSSPLVEVVFGHRLSSCRTLSAPAWDDRRCRAAQALLRPQQAAAAEFLSPAALDVRRDRVVAWLRQHRLPVEVSVNLTASKHFDTSDSPTVSVLDGLAVLRPPYTSCECDNELVLRRLETLLKSMPPDWDVGGVTGGGAVAGSGDAAGSGNAAGSGDAADSGDVAESGDVNEKVTSLS